MVIFYQCTSYNRRLFNSIYTSGGKVAVVELKSPQINISPNHKFPKFCQQRCGDSNKLYHGLQTNWNEAKPSSNQSVNRDITCLYHHNAACKIPDFYDQWKYLFKGFKVPQDLPHTLKYKRSRQHNINVRKGQNIITMYE